MRCEGGRQQATGRQGEGGREALYSREFERDRKEGRGDWLFRMQMVMTRDDDGGGAARATMPICIGRRRRLRPRHSSTSSKRRLSFFVRSREEALRMS